MPVGLSSHSPTPTHRSATPLRTPEDVVYTVTSLQPAGAVGAHTLGFITDYAEEGRVTFNNLF